MPLRSAVAARGVRICGILLALRVEVDPAHGSFTLVEADVVEALKTRAADGAHAVVRHQEVFFPAHKDVLTLRQVRDVEIALPSLFLEGSEGFEFRPVLQVDLVC